MDTNLKNITKLCKDIHTLCQNGTPSVRVAGQLGLQDLLDKLSGMPKPLASPTANNEKPKGFLEILVLINILRTCSIIHYRFFSSIGTKRFGYKK
jgi:hypothetical protein